MKKEDAIEIMSHLALKLGNVLAVEDLVSPFAEFLAHIQPNISDEDFAFLATIGGVIYHNGSCEYDSGMQTELLLQRIRQ